MTENNILSTTTSFTAIPVTDLDRARRYYEDVLGLTVQAEVPQEGGVVYTTGESGLYVYISAYAGTNKATAVGWEVDNFDTAVAELRTAGIIFDTFELEGITWDNGVAVLPGDIGKGVWFHDPDGNILSVSTKLTQSVT